MLAGYCKIRKVTVIFVSCKCCYSNPQVSLIFSPAEAGSNKAGMTPQAITLMHASRIRVYRKYCTPFSSRLSVTVVSRSLASSISDGLTTA